MYYIFTFEFFLSICSLYYFSSLILVFRDYWFVLIFISFWSLCSLVFFYYEISKSNYSLVSLSMLLTRSQLPLYDLYVCVCVCVCVFVCVKRDFEHPIPRKKSEKIGNCSVPVWCLLYDFDFLNFWFFFMLYYLLKACQILNQLCVTCEVPFRVWACVDEPFG